MAPAPTRDPRHLPQAGDRLHLQGGNGFLVEVLVRDAGLWLTVASDPDDPVERWCHELTIRRWRKLATGARVLHVAPAVPPVPKPPRKHHAD